MDIGPANIPINQQHLHAALGTDPAQIKGGRRFSLSWATTQDSNGTGGGSCSSQVQLGAKNSVALGKTRIRVIVREKLGSFRNDRQNADSKEPLHIIHGFDAGVQVLDKEGKAQPKNQPHHHTQGQVKL